MKTYLSRFNRYFLLMSLLLTAPAIRADVAVLIHGYLADSAAWEYSGVMPMLSTQGWQPAGTWVPGPEGMVPVTNPQVVAAKANKVYTVNLPAEAPIAVQANYLRPILTLVSQRHPTEPMFLIGHSAGGVVARFVLVTQPLANVKALITIASPHSGTGRAEQALDVANAVPFPFSIMADALSGGTYGLLRDSRGLYLDLVRPYPGSFLGWLNLQPHPDLQYISIVRSSPFMFGGDYVVPSYSQDMNNVPALQGKAKTIIANTGHELHPDDGIALAKIMADLKR